MLLEIVLGFSTIPGQQLKIFGNIPSLGNFNRDAAVPMHYLDRQHWSIKLKLDESFLKDDFVLSYGFQFVDVDGSLSEDWGEKRKFRLDQLTDGMMIMDSWKDMSSYEHVFETVPFSRVFDDASAQRKIENTPISAINFRVSAPMLAPHEKLALTGNHELLGAWLSKGYVPMEWDGVDWSASMNLGSTHMHMPLEYKYVVIGSDGKFMRYEEGGNRSIPITMLKSSSLWVNDTFFRGLSHWRGTGIAIPVFSLRSENGLGVGEFNDIPKLVDWAGNVGLKMVQILPVNDTTSTHTIADSYPYAAISAFALHPIYVSLEKIADNKHLDAIKHILVQKKTLNNESGVCYDEVMRLKWEALRILYNQLAAETFSENTYKEFYKENEEWLVPYAAFSHFRDKFQTPDTTGWLEFNQYDREEIFKCLSPSSPHHKEILFHLFIQYHLHLQLKEAHDYANSKGIILKGDIAIGVHKNGADTWVEPSLYHLDRQAGAPPDDFAVSGQNWGFPTYNWEVMKKDGFNWWQRRFRQMSSYFDAFRIDHILGFFRIWSIPEHAVEGIMGRFVPAIPVYRHEFQQRGIDMDDRRYCMPYITDQIIWEMAGQFEAHVRPFLVETQQGQYAFRAEYQHQINIERHFKNLASSDENKALKQILFDLQSNVVLWQDDAIPDAYHFRFNVSKTRSFAHFDAHTRHHLMELYNDYFFNRQDNIWQLEAMEKLPFLKKCTDMLICGEDLGLVPKTVPQVMHRLGLLSMEVQRMPKKMNVSFFDPSEAPYLSVVTPSTHDMSTIREWWLEDRAKSQDFYNNQMWQQGNAPVECSVQVSKAIVRQHLSSPAMWAVFQLQDLFSLTEDLRLDNPKEERINIPGDANHYWRFRMHVPLEDLMQTATLNEALKGMIKSTGRAC